MEISLVAVLTVVYVIAFQACAVPAIVRMVRRRSSADLSCWREYLLLIGVTAQFAVMWQTGAAAVVLISPILSGLNVSALLLTIWVYRKG